MLVALISDIHGHHTRLLLALARAQQLGCTHLLCMGDVDDMSTFLLLCEEWPHGLDLVFGNNEWQRESFLRAAKELPGVTHHGDTATLTLGGRNLFLCHYPHMAARACERGGYDAVFFGHTHRDECYPPTEDGLPLIVNPGDIQGRYGAPSLAVYDTEANSAQIIPL